MSTDKTSTSSHDQHKPKEEFGLTGVTTGSSGEHLATTGASALGSSGGSGDMGNEKSKIDSTTNSVRPSGTSAASSPAVTTD